MRDRLASSPGSSGRNEVDLEPHMAAPIPAESPAVGKGVDQEDASVTGVVGAVDTKQRELIETRAVICDRHVESVRFTPGDEQKRLAGWDARVADDVGDEFACEQLGRGDFDETV